jgi:hypothetical protein
MYKTRQGSIKISDNSRFYKYIICMDKIFSMISLFSVTLGIFLSVFLSKVLAADILTPQPLDVKSQIKAGIIACCLLLLFVCFLVCLLIASFAKDDKKVAFAMDAIKTLTGFFIGAITGYLG